MKTSTVVALGINHLLENKQLFGLKKIALQINCLLQIKSKSIWGVQKWDHTEVPEFLEAYQSVC